MNTIISKYKTIPKSGRNIIDLGLIFIAGIIIATIVKTFLFQGFYIPSSSMEPTLQINDRIIVNQLYPKLIPLQHGDVIVFQDNHNWMDGHPEYETSWFDSLNPLSTSKENFLVKRIIGLPGDTISYTKGDQYLTINGKPTKETYLPQNLESSSIEFNITVPQDSVWVMGDNRPNSSDSRYHQDQNGGFIQYKDIVGKADLLYYPLANAKSL